MFKDIDDDIVFDGPNDEKWDEWIAAAEQEDVKNPDLVDDDEVEEIETDGDDSSSRYLFASNFNVGRRGTGGTEQQ